jgi:hypothetical protein
MEKLIFYKRTKQQIGCLAEKIYSEVGRYKEKMK